MEQHFNEHVANLIEGNRCRCDDGSCDWCQIYYANDENLALIIESHLEAETKKLRDALHEAEAIGDFPSELRFRAELFDAGKAIGIENAELKGEINGLEIRLDEICAEAAAFCEIDDLKQATDSLGRIMEMAYTGAKPLAVANQIITYHAEKG